MYLSVNLDTDHVNLDDATQKLKAAEFSIEMVITMEKRVDVDESDGRYCCLPVSIYGVLFFSFPHFTNESNGT